MLPIVLMKKPVLTLLFFGTVLQAVCGNGSEVIPISDTTDQRVAWSGYIGLVDAGYITHFDKDPSGHVNLSLINGYKFNPYFSLGLGVGLRLYKGKNTPVIPVYLDLRVHFSGRKVRPWLATDLGSSANAQYYGAKDLALYCAQSVGIAFYTSRSVAVRVGVSTELQLFQYRGNTSLGYRILGIGDPDEEYAKGVAGIGLLLGITF